MARGFSGSERFIVEAGSVGNGVKTFAVIARLGGGADGSNGTIFHGGSATTGHSRWFLLKQADNTLFYSEDGQTAQTTGLTWIEADGWCCVGVSKASGGVPRFFKYVYLANSLAFENGNAAVPDGEETTWASNSFAAQPLGSLTPLYLSIAYMAGGFWRTALSDALIARLPYMLEAWWQQSPFGLWLFDQATTAQLVPDLTGLGADESGGSKGAIVMETPALTYSHDILFVGGAPLIEVLRSVVLPVEARGVVTQAQALPVESIFFAGGTVTRSLGLPLDALGLVAKAVNQPMDSLQTPLEGLAYPGEGEEKEPRRTGLAEQNPPRDEKYWSRLDSGGRGTP